MTIYVLIRTTVLVAFGIISSTAGISKDEARIVITADRSCPTMLSRLALGVTHAQYSLDSGGNQEIVAEAKALLRSSCHYQNQHIMGWGALNPNPEPGIYRWESLDRRIALIRSMNAVPVITLCAAPDWMKGGQPGETDWSQIEVAPLPEHYHDFAKLAKLVAQRYPDVKHYQVWNEMKGFWSREANNWDYVNYTRMYNMVYDALKRLLLINGLFPAE